MTIVRPAPARLILGWREWLSLPELGVACVRAKVDSGARSLLQLPTGQAWPIEINLTQRRNMLFPMLLGRTALHRRCLVEPARSFLLGTPATNEPTP